MMDKFSIEVRNDFRFQPPTKEKKLKMTAPAQKPGKRGLF